MTGNNVTRVWKTYSNGGIGNQVRQRVTHSKDCQPNDGFGKSKDVTKGLSKIRIGVKSMSYAKTLTQTNGP